MVRLLRLLAGCAVLAASAAGVGGCADGCSSASSASNANGAAPTANAATPAPAPTETKSRPRRPDRPRTESSYSGPPLPDEAREVASKVVAQLAQPHKLEAHLVSAPWVTKHGRIDDPSRVFEAAKQAYRDGRRNAKSATVRSIKACPADRSTEEILQAIGAAPGRPGLEKLIELGRTLPDAWIVWCDMAYQSDRSLIMDENILLVSRLSGGFKVHGVD